MCEREEKGRGRGGNDKVRCIHLPLDEDLHYLFVHSKYAFRLPKLNAWHSLRHLSRDRRNT